MAGPYKVLSIDGGGIRGLIPAVVLAELEARIGKPLYKAFDLIAGTSTGGIIAVGLTAPSTTGTGAAFSAADLVDFYEQDGGKIFYSPLLKRLSGLDDLVERRYDHKPLEKILKRKLGDKRMSEALKELLITSYDLHGGTPYFFKHSKAKENPAERDHLLWQAARATSAAPTYFEPYKMTGEGFKTKSLVDGGMFANNPSMCAYAEAMKHKGRDQDILMVSLGTGDEDFGEGEDNPPKFRHAKAKNWGVIGWARPAINIMMDGVSDTVNHQLRQMLVDAESATRTKPQRYYRFQTRLTDDTRDMDDADAHSLGELKKLGADIISTQSAELDRLADLLTT